MCCLQSYERLERKWFETKHNNTFLERVRIRRFNLRRLSVALAPHPSPLPREREPVTMHQPLVCGGGAYGLPGRCQKNPSL